MPLWSCFGVRRNEEVELSHSGLSQFPEEVFRHRRYLQTLVLDGNAIKCLPANVRRLSRLEKLSVADNELERLPRELFQISRLLELDVSDNGLRDLPNSIKHCKQMRTINLSANTISRIPDSLTQLRNLTHLCVNDTGIRYFPSGIDRLAQLVVLEARDNSVKILPRSLGGLTKLRRLDLGWNELLTLPAAIGQLGSLEELWLDSNQLSELPSEIGQLQNVAIIDLSENLLHHLPEKLPGCTSLTDLYLCENRLSELPESIGSLESLSVLKVNDNRLQTLPDSIGGLKKLTELVLANNKLTALPAAIGQLVSLSLLSAACNRLVSIPPEVGSCQSLAILNLRQNDLSDIPASLGSLTRLRVLDLCSNLLGHLPLSFERLSLSALWLSENQSRPLMDLEQDRETDTEGRVLTCCLLPQKTIITDFADDLEISANIADKADDAQQQERDRLRVAFVPGLAGDDNLIPELSSKLERHPTPYSKDLKMKGKRFRGNSIDLEQTYTGDQQPSPTSADSVHVEAEHGAIGRKECDAYAGVQEDSDSRPAEHEEDENILTVNEQTGEVNQCSPETTLAHQALLVPSTPPFGDPNVPMAAADDCDVMCADDKASSAGLEMQSKAEESPSSAGSITEHTPVLQAMQESNATSTSSSQHRVCSHPEMTTTTTADPTSCKGDQLPEEVTLNAREDHCKDAQASDPSVPEAERNATDDDNEAAVLAIEPARNDQNLPASQTTPKPGADISSPPAEHNSYPEDEVILERGIDKEPLGMSIIGGCDCSAVPFGNGSEDEGVFISKVNTGSLADKTGKLRMADRILAINDRQVDGETHSSVVALLLSSKTIKIQVRHEPLPRGFEIVRVLKANGEKLGLKISGGIGCSPGNPINRDDEGIFVHSLVAGGAADKNGQLRRGHRILEVNDQKMLGVSHVQAVNALKLAKSPVVLVVCHGFDADTTSKPRGCSENTEATSSQSTQPQGQAAGMNSKSDITDQEAAFNKGIHQSKTSHADDPESGEVQNHGAG